MKRRGEEINEIYAEIVEATGGYTPCVHRLAKNYFQRDDRFVKQLMKDVLPYKIGRQTCYRAKDVAEQYYESRFR